MALYTDRLLMYIVLPIFIPGWPIRNIMLLYHTLLPRSQVRYYAVSFWLHSFHECRINYVKIMKQSQSSQDSYIKSNFGQ